MGNNEKRERLGRGVLVEAPLGYEVFTKVLRCVALSRWHCVCPRREMGLCWIPRGRSVKARDVVILLFLHVLYMYVVSITIGDVYNDGVVTGNSSFATSHVRPFHAWMRAKDLGGEKAGWERTRSSRPLSLLGIFSRWLGSFALVGKSVC
jgi:hypothetical protein